MSDAVFPALPGLALSQVKVPAFSTKIQRAVSGRELRASFQQYPLTTFRLTHNLLRDGAAGTELATLFGFFLARQGSFDSFLFTDSSDNAVTDMAFGSGNGVATQFQLSRAYGAGGFTFAEPVHNVNVLSAVKLNGVVKSSPSDYSINGTGLVTFVVAPGAGVLLTWSGSLYYRCRFSSDTAEFDEFLKDFWENKKIEFIGAVGNRV
jgi:uncharacterized protein (TIGR02217 family)